MQANRGLGGSSCCVWGSPRLSLDLYLTWVDLPCQVQQFIWRHDHNIIQQHSNCQFYCINNTEFDYIYQRKTRKKRGACNMGLALLAEKYSSQRYPSQNIWGNDIGAGDLQHRGSNEDKATSANLQCWCDNLVGKLLKKRHPITTTGRGMVGFWGWQASAKDHCLIYMLLTSHFRFHQGYRRTNNQAENTTEAIFLKQPKFCNCCG